MTAAEAGQDRATVCAAPDLWALGCIAWELLTGERVFAPGAEPSHIVDTLTGKQALPWEREAEHHDGQLPKLRVLRRSVLACLQRDPAARPTSRELLGAWNGLFESMTGTTRDTFEPSAM